jgi:NitT/TauT family transport system permease protein
MRTETVPHSSTPNSSAPSGSTSNGSKRPAVAKATRPRRVDALPVAAILAAVVVIWYIAAPLMNISGVRDRYEREETTYTSVDLVWGAWNAERPLLPTPHQIIGEIAGSIFSYPPDSNRSLVYHAWVTLSATVTGFVMGALLGIVLAILIIYVQTLEKSLLPWIISSQTIPILAIAPIVIVVLGAIGIRGLLPKSLISAYLCFFPITVGMVKGLNSPDPIQRDLMRTYSASGIQTFIKLRWPSSLSFLFTSLKVAVAASLVGAIVSELPTGAQAGIGARLLAGSYYGQTVQMWAALVVASLLAAALVAIIGLVERAVFARMGRAP